MESRYIARHKNEDFYEAVLSQQEEMLLYNIVEDVKRIGYEVMLYVLPACAVGAPHQRDRIFIVGYTKHNGLPSAEVGRCLDTTGTRSSKGEKAASKFKRTSGYRDCESMADNTQCAGIVSGAKSGIQGQEQNADTQRICEDVANTDGERVQGREAIRNIVSQRETGEQFTFRFCECTSGNVCNTTGTGLPDRSGVTMEGQEAEPKLKRPGGNVSDTVNRSGAVRRDRKFPNPSEAKRQWDYHRGGEEEYVSGQWWAVEPDVGRVAYGIPNRVDRIKGLGNAVVPQQVYPILKTIAEIETASLPKY